MTAAAQLAARGARMTVDFAASPTIDSPHPRFDWVFDDLVPDYESVTVIVSSTRSGAEAGVGDLWESAALPGHVAFVLYDGAPLYSRASYWWRVLLQDGPDARAGSPVAAFHTGILSDAEWKGRWIGRADSPRRLLRLPCGQAEHITAGEQLIERFHFDAPVGALSADISPVGSGSSARLELHRGDETGELLAEWSLDDSWGRYFSWWGALDNPLPAGEFALVLSVSQGEATWSRSSAHSLTLSVTEPDDPAFSLRRDFTLPAEVERATLYATGLGYHEVTINGASVSSAVLDPAVTDYGRRVLYNREPVNGLVAGSNSIEIALGHGYFATPGANIWGWHAAPWTDDPRAIAELHIDLVDGTTVVIATDQEWTVEASPVRRDSLYEGEQWAISDAAPPDSTRHAVFVEPPAGELRVQYQPRITAARRPEHPAVVKSSPELVLLDVGRTTAGWLELSCRAKPHSTVTVTYGELQEDAEHGVRNVFIDGRPQVDTIRLGADGTLTRWQPAFTYKGFRYVSIAGDELVVDEASAVEVHSAVVEAGTFSSSSALVDWIDKATHRTILNNLQGIPTDTPVHEKNGWTGDAHLIARTAMYQFDLNLLLRKWLDDFRDSQDGSGAIPVIVPTTGWGREDCPVFSSAFPIIVWDHYLHYGDRRVLEENLDAVTAFARHLAAELAPTGTWEGYSWGDWMSPGHDYAPEGPALAGTAFCYESMRRTLWIAAELGRADTVADIGTAATALHAAFNRRFLDRDRGLYRTAPAEDYRQGSNVFALAFDLVPDEFRERVVANLVHDIRVTRADHLNTGSPSTRYLLPVLSNAGHDELAVTLLLQTTHPSWGFWREQGGDTLWEKWGLDSRSRNHYFFGTVSQWMRERVGGLAIDRPGAVRLRFDPVDDERIDAGRCSVAVGQTQARASWQRDGEHLRAHLSIPRGCSVVVVSRDGDHELGAGEHTFTLAGRHDREERTPRKDRS